MSLTQALRDLIARYEYDGIPSDSLPTVEAARAALATPSLTYERVKQLWREASMTYNEDRDPSPVHLFATAVEREHGIVGEASCKCGAGTIADALLEGEVRGSIFGDVVITRNAAGAIVLVSRQDDEGRTLAVIAEAGKWGVRKLGVGMSSGECIIFDTKGEADQQAAHYGGDVVPLTYENGRWTAPAYGVPGVKPAAMIEAADAHRLADELEELRRSHWSHWTAQEVHVAATAVRHLRLLAEHNRTPGVALPETQQEKKA